jgi:hypothetical protein
LAENCQNMFWLPFLSFGNWLQKWQVSPRAKYQLFLLVSLSHLSHGESNNNIHNIIITTPPPSASNQ